MRTMDKGSEPVKRATTRRKTTASAQQKGSIAPKLMVSASPMADRSRKVDPDLYCAIPDTSNEAARLSRNVRRATPAEPAGNEEKSLCTG